MSEIKTLVKEVCELISINDKHILLSGITGTSKTAFMERIADSKWDEGKKIIFFTLKDEATLLGFSEDDPYLVSLINSTGYFPSGFPTEVLVPFVRSDYDKGNEMKIVLPKHSDEFIAFQKESKVLGNDYGWTEWKPFKLDFTALKPQDLIGLSGEATETGLRLLEFVFRTGISSIDNLLGKLISLSKKVDDPDGTDLEISLEQGKFKAKIGKRESYLSLISLVSAVKDTGLVCDKKCPFSLNLDVIMRNTETITIFNLSNLEEKFEFMVLASLLRQIKELRDEKKNYPQCVLCVPELPQLAGKNSENPFCVVSKPAIQYMSKQGRLLAITLMGDTQTPKDIVSSVLNNFGWLCLTNLGEEAIDYIHRNIVKLEKPVKKNLGGLKTGTYAIIEKESRRYDYPCLASPARGKHLKPGVNPLDWIAAQDYIQQETYIDKIPSTLFVAIKERKEAVLESISKILLNAKNEQKAVLKDLKKQNKAELSALKIETRKNVKDKLREIAKKDLIKQKTKVEKNVYSEIRKKMIFEASENGFNQPEIAKFTGLSQVHVSRILRGKS